MVAERIGEHCLYFSNGDRQNWTSSHDQCQQLGAEMAASHVLQPLKQFLRHAFGEVKRREEWQRVKNGSTGQREREV